MTILGRNILFLGILRDGEGIATDILENLGIVLAEIKELIEKKIRTERNIDQKARYCNVKVDRKNIKACLSGGTFI